VKTATQQLRVSSVSFSMASTLGAWVTGQRQRCSSADEITAAAAVISILAPLSPVPASAWVRLIGVDADDSSTAEASVDEIAA
jgi:hypothetical protein